MSADGLRAGFFIWCLECRELCTAREMGFGGRKGGRGTQRLPFFPLFSNAVLSPRAAGGPPTTRGGWISSAQ